MTMLEKAARAAAHANGDDYDAIPADKGEWIKARGMYGGRFRDINEPMKIDYDEIARAVLAAIREPDDAMLSAAYGDDIVGHGAAYTAMIDTILEGETPA